MRFNKNLLKKFHDNGKNVCAFSDSIISYLNEYSYKDFPDFSTRLYYYWKKGTKAIPLEIILKIMYDNKLNSVEIDSFSMGGGNNIYPPNENGILFYYFLGLILGDGCLIHAKREGNKNTYLIQISFRKKENALKIQKVSKELFGIGGSIYSGRRYFNLCLFSKPLVLLLHHKYQIPIGLKYNEIRVPNIVKRNPNKKTVKAFLKGVFDSDGNIYRHRKNKCVQLRQKSYSFIDELRQLFVSLDLNFRNPYFDRANRSWVLWTSKKELVDNFINQVITLKIRPGSSVG